MYKIENKQVDQVGGVELPTPMEWLLNLVLEELSRVAYDVSDLCIHVEVVSTTVTHVELMLATTGKAGHHSMIKIHTITTQGQRNQVARLDLGCTWQVGSVRGDLWLDPEGRYSEDGCTATHAALSDCQRRITSFLCTYIPAVERAHPVR